MNDMFIDASGLSNGARGGCAGAEVVATDARCATVARRRGGLQRRAPCDEGGLQHHAPCDEGGLHRRAPCLMVSVAVRGCLL